MDSERLWLLLPSPVRNLPADIGAVLALVVLTNLAVLLPVVRDSPARIIFGLAFVLFVPGYAFVAALFPERGTTPADSSDDTPDANALGDRGVDGIERAALSFGLSIAIVPLIGLVLNFTPFGIRLMPILVGISAFSVVAALLAASRRRQLPEEERFRVPYREWVADGKAELFAPESTFDAALNVALVVAILLATTSVVYAVAVPQQGEQFSEFYVLSEDSDGELVAAEYPEELTAGESTPIHVGVENNEYDTVDYTVVVQLQRVETEGNETIVQERTEIDRYSTTLGHNETDIRQRNLSVDGETAAEFEGTDRRVVFLLYRGEPTDRPTRANAYRDLHIWVEVTTEESGS